MYDAIIVGGSYAGLSAGLQLARARRKTLVIDAGKRCNRFAATSHGFLTQDARLPAEIAQAGRAQLLAYPTVERREGEVVQAEKTLDGFVLALAGGGSFLARRLVLALGVTDLLPNV